MSIDKVLAALDAGLQSSDEHGYPERIDDSSLCARCVQSEPAADGDLCAPCRAFLLGDSNVDPRRDSHATFLDEMIEVMSRPVDLRGYVVHHLNGDSRDNRPENLRIMSAREHVERAHEERPAAFRVSTGIEVPEWCAVTCDRCGAIYACNPERTPEAQEIMYADGHGLAGRCDPLTRTAPQRRDWQAEAFAHVRQIFADARERLGL